jgi:hypothetical protein
MVITSRFAGRCKRCGGAYPVGAQIEWDRVLGARHVTAAECQAAKAAPVPVVNLAPVVAFLRGAQARGLKCPKARFLAPGGGELRLSMAGTTSRYPGALQVRRNDEWIGRVMPDGSVEGPLAGDAEIITALVAIAAAPAEAARAYGVLMCRCSFCDLALTDAGSVEVGYGPICAKKWGLPHSPKGTPAVAA